MVVSFYPMLRTRQISLPSMMTNPIFVCDDIHLNSILCLKMKQSQICFEVEAVRQIQTFTYLCKVSSMYILLLFQNNDDFH